MIRLAKNFVLLVALSVHASGAHAQSVSRDFRSLGAFRDVFEGRQAINSLMMEGVAEPPATVYGMFVGVGYTRSKNGASTTSVPGELSAKLGDGRAVFLLDGEYDWARSPGGTASGVGAPAVTFAYRLTEQPDVRDAFAVRATISTPSGTEVSDGSATQALAILWNHRFTTSDWMRLSAWATHTNDDVPAGVDAYGVLGKFFYQHKFAKGGPLSDWFFTLSYAHRSGAVNATVAGGGIDFPFARNPVGPFKEITGTLFGFCKLSTGQRCGHIEFDLNLTFR